MYDVDKTFSLFNVYVSHVASKLNNDYETIKLTMKDFFYDMQFGKS